jgi:glutamate synthase (NADPH/NADH) small chain
MATKMLRFVSVDRETPEKRAAGERSHDFHEIYAEYAAAKAAEQADRP